MIWVQEAPLQILGFNLLLYAQGLNTMFPRWRHVWLSEPGQISGYDVSFHQRAWHTPQRSIGFCRSTEVTVHLLLEDNRFFECISQVKECLHDKRLDIWTQWRFKLNKSLILSDNSSTWLVLRHIRMPKVSSASIHPPVFSGGHTNESDDYDDGPEYTRSKNYNHLGFGQGPCTCAKCLKKAGPMRGEPE